MLFYKTTYPRHFSYKNVVAIKYVFQRWAIPGLFFIFIFSIQLTVNVQYKFLPMTGFKLRTSDIGSYPSTNWVTTTARHKMCYPKILIWAKLCLFLFIFARDSRMKGADESTELWLFLLIWNTPFSTLWKAKLFLGHNLFKFTLACQGGKMRQLLT